MNRYGMDGMDGVDGWIVHVPVHVLRVRRNVLHARFPE